MIRKDGVVKLMDFGIAQIVDLQRMTVTGQLLGSPAYMAPELVEGKPLDFRTDVFSVGIMLYQLATGSLPFSGKNPHEVLKRIAEGKFADPRTVEPRRRQRRWRGSSRGRWRASPTIATPTIGQLVADLTAYLAEAGLVDVARRAARVLRRSRRRTTPRCPGGWPTALTAAGAAPPGRAAVGAGAGAVEPGAGVRSRTTRRCRRRCAGWRGARA